MRGGKMPTSYGIASSTMKTSAERTSRGARYSFGNHDEANVVEESKIILSDTAVDARRSKSYRREQTYSPGYRRRRKYRCPFAHTAVVLAHLMFSVDAAGPSNPYASGCLRAKLGGKSFPKGRVCNSDDDRSSSNDINTAAPSCSEPEFKQYPEIRIGPGNWESSIFQAYILQIVLSEMVGVPATIESGSADTLLSFYDEEGGFPYPDRAYPYEDLKAANAAPGGDCRPLLKEGKTCSHILPEVWDGQYKSMVELRTEGHIEQPQDTATVGKLSWYVPKFVVAQDPSLATYLGIGDISWASGEKNRRRMAEKFLRPTTWFDYCSEVSETNCTVKNEVAQRAPTSVEIENGTGDKYRLDDVYTGFFRKTAESDCDLNPKNCTGHIVDCPCTWSTNVEQQIYWNDIPLSSSGPLMPNHGYSYSDMVDIWSASVETQSPVVMWWYTPDPTVQKWKGTKGELHPIALPEATEACRLNRVGSNERCSDDVWTRRGKEEGKCGNEAHSLKKLIASSLQVQTYATPPAERSPGYDTAKNIAVGNLNLDKMFSAWEESGDPREAVCSWVVDNIDYMLSSIPSGYPRNFVKDEWYSGASELLYTAFAFGAFAVFVVAVSSLLVFRYRQKRVIRNAQIDFQFLILSGCLLIAVGAIVYSLEPTRATCTAKEWLVMLGYTLSIVPLLVKAEAINHIARAGKKMKRVQLQRRQLHGAVLVVVLLVLCYLIVWSIVDPPIRDESLVINDAWDENVDVEQQVQCLSNSDAWKIIGYCWEFLLVIVATVCAFQARNVRQDFNEAGSLAQLAYVKFFFLVLRAIMFALRYSGYLSPSVESGVNSLFLSLDTLASVGIYFGPKFYLLYKGGEAAKSIWGLGVNGSSNISIASNIALDVEE